MSGERYALHLKEPTPAEVEQNHIALARMLAGTGQSAEEIAQTFNFPIEQAQGIVDEASRIKYEGSIPPPAPEYPWSKIPYVDPDVKEQERLAIAQKEEEERVRANRDNLRAALLQPRQPFVIDTPKPQSDEVTEKDADCDLTSIESEFLKGFMLGKFSFEEVGSGSEKVLKVISSSDVLRNRLIGILGSYGDINDVPTQTTIKLNFDRFAFLKGEAGMEIPKGKEDFAAFFMGLIHGRMSERGGRITVDEDFMMHKIKKAFEMHYMDKTVLSLLQDRSTYKGQVREFEVLRVKNQQKVIDYLLGGEELKGLPFYDYLKEFYNQK